MSRTVTFLRGAGVYLRGHSLPTEFTKGATRSADDFDPKVLESLRGQGAVSVTEPEAPKPEHGAPKIRATAERRAITRAGAKAAETPAEKQPNEIVPGIKDANPIDNNLDNKVEAVTSIEDALKTQQPAPATPTEPETPKTDEPQPGIVVEVTPIEGLDTPSSDADGEPTPEELDASTKESLIEQVIDAAKKTVATVEKDFTGAEQAVEEVVAEIENEVLEGAKSFEQDVEDALGLGDPDAANETPDSGSDEAAEPKDAPVPEPVVLNDDLALAAHLQSEQQKKSGKGKK